MKREEKIRLAAERSEEESNVPGRDQTQRDPARREWGAVRKTAREAYFSKRDWKAVLNNYRTGDGFYTTAERGRMCDAYAEELINKAIG